VALSLSRTAGVSIVLETRIEVTGDGACTARIEVDAPRDVTILRAELL
jgi:sRNA-binding carbon storage regulator CsrA